MSVNVITGDCLEVMPTLEGESIDAIICDPPYGLSFMGKSWDHGVPGVPFWTEALRVAKPGAYLLAFGGTRTQHRLTVAIEDAGWEIRDCLMWLYGSGFPKSLDVSKAIDKAAGAEREIIGENPFTKGRKFGQGHHEGWERPWMLDDDAAAKHLTAPTTDAAKQWQGWGTALKPSWEPIIMARKPFKQTVAANVQEHGCGALNIDKCRIVSDTSPHEIPDREGGSGSGEEKDSSRCPVHGMPGVWPRDAAVEIADTAGEVAADVWDDMPSEAHVGCGEPALARRDMDRGEDGLSSNHHGNTKLGGSGTTPDDCAPRSVGTPSSNGSHDRAMADESGTRSPHQRREGGQPARKPQFDGLDGSLAGTSGGDSSPLTTRKRERHAEDCTCVKVSAAGRWPANVLLDEIAAGLLDEQSGASQSGIERGRRGLGGLFGPSVDGVPCGPQYGDSGGASRFFYTAKASRSERERGLSGMEERLKKGNGSHNGRIDTDPLSARFQSMARNHHPTVKPIALMRWLCRLVTPPNGLILDPFTGSGSTGCAAVLEGFRFIGIEKEAEYAAIARKRIAETPPSLFGEVA